MSNLATRGGAATESNTIRIGGDIGIGFGSQASMALS
jgi:hypothetical protein